MVLSLKCKPKSPKIFYILNKHKQANNNALIILIFWESSAELSDFSFLL